MIIDKLHERFTYLSNARAREIRVDKASRTVFCSFSIPNSAQLDGDKRNEVRDFVATQIPAGYSCRVQWLEDAFSDTDFKNLLIELIKKRYPLFAFIDGTKIAVNVDGYSVFVEFFVDKVTKDNMEIADFLGDLNKFFKEYTYYSVDIRITLDSDSTVSFSRKEQERLVQLAINKELLKPSRYFRITNVQKYIGKTINAMPMYIYDVRNPSDSCVLCGRISSKSTKPSKNNPNLQVCKFTLTDDSQASIQCVMFVKFKITDVDTLKATSNKGDAEVKTLSVKAKLANEKIMDKILKLYDGTEIVVRGKISFNEYSEHLEMVVYDLCKCRISSSAEQPQEAKPAPQNYFMLTPEIYTEYKQSTFVDETEFKSALQDKEYVLLHINATGLNIAKDKIIALCAVKIVNGHIAAKMFTYVNPDTTVSYGVLQDAKIEAEKLVFYPTLTEIIGDLYKFTYGCDIIGLNLERIIEFLNYYAAPIGYRFSNNLIDQPTFLSQLFDTSVFEKKPNCTKYVEISKICKVSCPSYVFCGETAVTIAKCLCVVAGKQIDDI